MQLCKRDHKDVSFTLIALIGCLLASASALADFVAPLLAPATPILDIHAVLPQPNRQAIAVAVVGGRFMRFELDGNPLTPSARERFGVRHAFSTSEVRATPEGSFWQLHSPDTGFIAPPGFNQGIQFELRLDGSLAYSRNVGVLRTVPVSGEVWQGSANGYARFRNGVLVGETTFNACPNSFIACSLTHRPAAASAGGIWLSRSTVVADASIPAGSRQVLDLVRVDRAGTMCAVGRIPSFPSPILSATDQIATTTFNHVRRRPDTVGRLRHRDAQGRWSRPFAPVAPSYFYGVHESGDLLVLSGPRAGPFELVRVRSHSNGALSFSRRSLPLSFSPISIGGVGTFGVVGDRWLQYADDEALHALELPISLSSGEAILIDGFEPRVP